IFGNRPNGPMAPLVSKRLFMELSVRKIHQPAGSSQPETTAPVFVQREDKIIVQPILNRVPRQYSIFQPADAAIAARGPDAAIARFDDIDHPAAVGFTHMARVEIRELNSVETRQSLIRGQPKIPITGLNHCTHDRAVKTVTC